MTSLFLLLKMSIHKFLLLHYCFVIFLYLAGNRGVVGVTSSSHHHRHLHKHAHHGHSKKTTKLFVFGDSYADTGNNNKSTASSWKVPYGVTFPGAPAGRYSDGRVLTDFLARFLGIKTPPAYALRQYAPKRLLRYGMNFAYGGTGVTDYAPGPNMTAQIDFLQQLVNDSVFTVHDLRSSVVLVSVAGNDYGGYILSKGAEVDVISFIHVVVNQMASDLKRIHNMGAKKVAVVLIEPLGCLPGNIAKLGYESCNETQNTFATYHNLLLSQAISKLNNESKEDSPFVVLDLYSSFMSALNNNGNTQFTRPLKPCCIGISSEYYCGYVGDDGKKKYYKVCDNPKEAFFWDVYHPSQAGWRAVYLELKETLQQLH